MTQARIAGASRGRYVALVAFLSTGLSVGTTGYAFGAFVSPLESEFEWTRAQLNFGLSLAFISGVMAPIAGRLMDRFGARPVMTGSLLLIAAGFLLRPLIHELWQFYLFSGIVYVGMPGASILPAGRLVAAWFPRTSGRMMGLVTSGNNFGGLTTVPLATAVIAVAGWRWGFVSFGFLAAAIAVLAFLIVRDRPEDGDRTADRADRLGRSPAEPNGLSSGQAMRTATFYLMTLGITAGYFTYSVVLTQLIPHLENEGFSAAAAAAALTAMAGFGLASKLIFGRLSEALTARLAFVVSLGIQAAGLMLLIVLGGSPVAWLAVAVFGLGFGGMGALTPLMIWEAFGLRAFGAIMGLVSFVGIVPALVGPIFAGLTFDATGNYQLAFAITVGLYISGAIALLAARARPSEAILAATDH